MSKQHKHHIFLLTGEQWLGVLILGILIVGTLIVVKHFQPIREEATTWTNDTTKAQFADYQQKQDSLRRAAWRKKYARDTIEIRMQRFDPNTADSSTLVHLGLKPWQAKNMLKYRAKGGKYRKAEDMKKLYGMTDSMYQALAPYIYIARAGVDSMVVDSMKLDSVGGDTLPKWPVKKDTVLNLRTADTTALKMIRGIGSYRARQIVRYREQLGGFTHVEQILEAKGLEGMDSLLQNFYIDSVKVEQMDVNSVSVKRLSRHPYLRFEQAQAIYNLRRKKISLDSIEDLQGIEGMDAQTLNKLAPYLNFDKK